MSGARRGSESIDLPRWDDARLEKDRTKAIEVFREDRMREPLEMYLDVFETYRDAFDTLLETTVDLTMLSEKAIEILSDRSLLEAARYLAAPPISEDDLKTLAEATSLTPKVIQASPALASRIIDTIREGLDRQRFPWMSEGREATESERASAVLASTALLATQRVATERRSESKEAQETAVYDALRAAGLKNVDTRTVLTLSQAPAPGTFCVESLLGDRKADLIVGLWDRRVMAIECKVSNSATNSVKRLNNDAAAKATHWVLSFGVTQVVPAAVLSGVFKLLNLSQAQTAGLALFWAHDLAALTTWIASTRKPLQSPLPTIGRAG